MLKRAREGCREKTGMPVDGGLALARVVLKLRRTIPPSYHLEIIV
jgi:hypothetical protein